MAEEDCAIAKLVFLRELSGGALGRKAVVPLVEGADFEQFLARVRGRLALPESHAIVLREDDDIQVVDSIERLLEVDESTTLTLTFEPLEHCAASTPTAVAAARRPAAQKPAAAAGCGACTVDIGTSPAIAHAPTSRLEAEGIETGELKYRKKRGIAASLAHLSKLRLYVACISVALGVVLVSLMLFY
uniref:Uncharacterized protein n=1 Tax=Coccolithus braarudii TaxID=221442 RepID=A0A7S0LRU7_9EUKA|mmetsp:Transcript_5390/g.11892  ORF Transcript_5390/g.11892 Transcript_5390/m.11892 type:complete len:188 (+) Transcript_5390:20-583(+)|eukprot:CAMPEP_0183356734 /NCGR_PEP_ID=MMETSP0164_2-20130417/45158_1 /TAXON_ID=221442 /ORGANISM="Coccolithus pelagicus ssp braarudi, Strain PLY182g" /LENGTH=187 /DNA_ID=CAMNT_0025530213 /DNA_START=8 /DNA_END=571 /DNA_ORIENTATION=-